MNPKSDPAAKTRSVAILVIAELAGMSLWFATAAILPDIIRESAIDTVRQALLSSAVQAGFVIGALVIAITGIADRWDPRRLMAGCAIAAAITNACLLLVDPGGTIAVYLRLLTGILLAGVYPVGMKIMVGWGIHDRGLLVGLLVGALTLGNAVPYLTAWIGGTNWRATLLAISMIAAGGGALALFAQLGPYHAQSTKFKVQAITVAWTNIAIRRAYLGYLGHMWELFSMWAWIAAATAASFALTMDGFAAEQLGKLTAFTAIALGAIFCVPAGWLADRIGKAEIAIIALAISGCAALATAASFGGPAGLTVVFAIIWGLAVIPDSAQFSALVADHSPPELVGSLMTLQTALGFALTIVTVQITPSAAAIFGWPAVLAAMAIGPAVGIVAMWPLRRG